jgi:DNA-binding NarL/FixJ family response regulator
MNASPKLVVFIMHHDQLVSAGLEAAFRMHAEFEVIVGDALPVSGLVDLVVADFDNGMKLVSAPTGRELPVMIVSSEDGEASIREALTAGIRGYLLLGSPIGAVVESARVIVRGGLIIDPHAAAKMMGGLNDPQLTKRELVVLGLLVRGLSDKEMATRLGCATGTIKCHVKNIRKKLKAKSRTEAIFTSQRRGLLPRNIYGNPGVPVNSVEEQPPRRRLDSPRSQFDQSIRPRTQ